MASLPYPLCHDCTANLVGMARMPYPPTICKDYSELLLMKRETDVVTQLNAQEVWENAQTSRIEEQCMSPFIEEVSNQSNKL